VSEVQVRRKFFDPKIDRNIAQTLSNAIYEGKL
jgi:hypothetical protein